MSCQHGHRFLPILEGLPHDQGKDGRHKCAGCAYHAGFEAGENRLESLQLNLNSLSESQAGTGRHKSPHAAYALGYLHGVMKSYGMEY